MIRLILGLSASTPAILFTYLLLKYNVQKYTPSLHLDSQRSNPKRQRVEKLFEDHFEKLVAVQLNGKQQTINAYVNAKTNGSYQILTLDGKLVLEVKKNFSGWLVTKEGNAVKNPEQFLMPLILMLERRFYN